MRFCMGARFSMPIKLKLLRWEICAALILKVLLLYCLWKLCFSHPLSHSIDAPVTVKHVLSTKGDSYDP